MVARDGGIFSFGDATFYGSLPGHRSARERRRGHGVDAVQERLLDRARRRRALPVRRRHAFNSYAPSACDPVAAIFSNPRAQGLRLVLRSGATVPIGKAPGGSYPTGVTVGCPPGYQDPVVITIDEYDTVVVTMSYDDVVAVIGGPGLLVEDYKRYGHDVAFYRWVAPGERERAHRVLRLPRDLEGAGRAEPTHDVARRVSPGDRSHELPGGQRSSSAGRARSSRRLAS